MSKTDPKSLIIVYIIVVIENCRTCVMYRISRVPYNKNKMTVKTVYLGALSVSRILPLVQIFIYQMCYYNGEGKCSTQTKHEEVFFQAAIARIRGYSFSLFSVSIMLSVSPFSIQFPVDYWLFQSLLKTGARSPVEIKYLASSF